MLLVQTPTRIHHECMSLPGRVWFFVFGKSRPFDKTNASSDYLITISEFDLC
jgi:hypothetical protein